MSVSFDVLVRYRTDKAILVEVDGEEIWIPLSQIIEEETDVSESGDEGILTITDWIAKEKNLR